MRQDQVTDEPCIEHRADQSQVFLKVVRIGETHPVERDKGTSAGNRSVILELRKAVRMPDDNPTRIDPFLPQNVELVEAKRRADGMQRDRQTCAAMGSASGSPNTLFGGGGPTRVCTKIP